MLQRILAGEKPSIPPRFLYDELGSHLFTLITELESYYPTRTEAALFARHIEDGYRQAYRLYFEDKPPTTIRVSP